MAGNASMATALLTCPYCGHRDLAGRCVRCATTLSRLDGFRPWRRLRRLLAGMGLHW